MARRRCQRRKCTLVNLRMLTNARGPGAENVSLGDQKTGPVSFKEAYFSCMPSGNPPLYFRCKDITMAISLSRSERPHRPSGRERRYRTIAECKFTRGQIIQPSVSHRECNCNGSGRDATRATYLGKWVADDCHCVLSAVQAYSTA